MRYLVCIFQRLRLNWIYSKKNSIAYLAQNGKTHRFTQFPVYSQSTLRIVNNMLKMQMCAAYADVRAQMRSTRAQLNARDVSIPPSSLLECDKRLDVASGNCCEHTIISIHRLF